MRRQLKIGFSCWVLAPQVTLVTLKLNEESGAHQSPDEAKESDYQAPLRASGLKTTNLPQLNMTNLCGRELQPQSEGLDFNQSCYLTSHSICLPFLRMRCWILTTQISFSSSTSAFSSSVRYHFHDLNNRITKLFLFFRSCFRRSLEVLGQIIYPTQSGNISSFTSRNWKMPLEHLDPETAPSRSEK